MIVIGHIQRRDVVILRCLIDQLPHGFADADASLDFNKVHAHAASDLVFIKGLQHGNIAFGFIINEVDEHVALRLCKALQQRCCLVNLHAGKDFNLFSCIQLLKINLCVIQIFENIGKLLRIQNTVQPLPLISCQHLKGGCDIILMVIGNAIL